MYLSPDIQQQFYGKSYYYGNFHIYLSTIVNTHYKCYCDLTFVGTDKLVANNKSSNIKNRKNASTDTTSVLVCDWENDLLKMEIFQNYVQK